MKKSYLLPISTVEQVEITRSICDPTYNPEPTSGPSYQAPSRSL